MWDLTVRVKAWVCFSETLMAELNAWRVRDTLSALFWFYYCLMTCVLYLSVICNLLWYRLKVFLTLFGESELEESHGAKGGSRNNTRQQAAHMKEKHRQTGWKLDWWLTYRVWLWNPSTRHTYHTYLMDHNICKYLLFRKCHDTVQCECVNVNLRSLCLLFI